MFPLKVDTKGGVEMQYEGTLYRTWAPLKMDSRD